jgi:hypothetical protein
MNLTLKNFREQIDSAILERGSRYFRGGQIIDLEEEGDGIWSARVEGTELYDVVIEQGPAGTLTCECTCPYDWGPICKHIAAVLYAIEEASPEYAEDKPDRLRKKRKTRAEKVDDTLIGLSHEELVELLTELAREDRQIANLILARFSNEGSDKKAYIRLVKDALNMGKGQYGFIDYYGSGRAARGVRSVLQRADVDMKRGQVSDAVPVYQAVIETVVPAIAHADDSNGALGDCIHLGLEGLSAASKQLPPDEQHELFNYCLTEAPHERYSGWDWGWDLAQIAADMVTTEEQRKHLYSVLDRMAAPQPGDAEYREWQSRFYYEQAEAIKLTVIDRLDDDDARLAFLAEHVEIEQFREHMVRYYVVHRNLDEARRLCIEWLEQPAPHYRGYKPVFLDLLLEIAQQEKQTDEIARLAEELFFDTGRFKYFDLLKETIPGDKWTEFRGQLIARADRSSRSYELAPEIYVREEMWRQLLNAMGDAYRNTIEHYREHLEPRFPDEVSAIYERIVWKLMKEKAERKGYKEACKYIRRMKQLGQDNRARALVEALRTKYSNRPALLDELSKIK